MLIGDLRKMHTPDTRLDMRLDVRGKRTIQKIRKRDTCTTYRSNSSENGSSFKGGLGSTGRVSGTS